MSCGLFMQSYFRKFTDTHYIKLCPHESERLLRAKTAMSLTWRNSYSGVVVMALWALLLPPSLTVVNGAVTCSRCKRKRVENVFFTWTCPLSEPPEDDTICYTDCNRYNMLPDDFTCAVDSFDGGDTSCFCFSKPPQYCPAGRHTTAYRCDETLYVCWNLVPPQVFGLWDETGNSCTQTNTHPHPITDLVYCDVSDVNMKGAVFQDDDCGGWCQTAASSAICPNGKAIEEKFQITAPTNSGDGFWSDYEDSRGKADGDVGFCDFGGESLTDGWIVNPPVEYTCPNLPILSCPTSMVVASEPGKCGAVIEYSVTAQSPSNVFAKIIEPVREKGYKSGSLFPIGTTEMLFTYSLGPDKGILACQFTVTVLEDEHTAMLGQKRNKKCAKKKEKKSRKGKKPNKEKQNRVRARFL
jgi:hypothetical protein